MLSQENGQTVNILTPTTIDLSEEKLSANLGIGLNLPKLEDSNGSSQNCSEDSERFMRRKISNKIQYPCHFFPCMKVYKSRENLDLHIQNFHLNVKPYKCELCEKRFSHRNGKNYHKRTTHLKNVLLFNCPVKGCYKNYSSESALASHKQSKHENFI